MIKISNLKKIYRSNKSEPNTVIEDFCLDIGDKGMIFILGKSGSGKTTLMNLIGGLDSYDNGEISVNGKSTRKYTNNDFDAYRKQRIGFIFQEHNILTSYTVKKNLSIALELQGQEASIEKIMQALRQVELEDFVDRYPEELSTGQKQRVAIARALVKSPDIILADEPTGSLDSETGKVILDKLKELSREKLVIVITHDRDSAFKYGDRIVELSDGKIINDVFKDKSIIEEHKDESSGNIELVKSNMKFTDIFKLSYQNLIAKRTRLIFTLLLSTIAFTLFGVADTISSYDENNALLHSLNEVDRNYIFLSKYSNIFDSHYNEYKGQSPSFNDEDFQYMSDNFPHSEFYPVFYNYYGGYDSSVSKKSLREYETSGGKYYSFDIKGSTEISDKMLTDLDIKLIAGRLPIENDTDNEIVITKYTYDTFAKFELEQGEIDIEINSMQDILGKSFKDFIIVGIVDTNLYEERYKLIDDNKDVDSDTIRNISFEFQDITQYGLHALLYFREGYYSEVVDPQQIVSFEDTNIQLLDDNHYLTIGHVYCGSLFSDFDGKVYYLGDKQISKLEYDEVVIPFDMLPKYGIPGIGIVDTYSNLNDKIFDKVDKLVEEFVYDNFVQIKSDFELINGTSTPLDYKDYILNNSLNEYQEGKDYNYFQDEARKQVLNEEIFNKLNNNERIWFNNFGNLGEDFDINVVGVYFPENPNEDFESVDVIDNPMLLSESLLNYLDNDIGSMIVKLSENNGENSDLIEMGEIDRNTGIINVDYQLQSEYKQMITYAGGYISFTSLILVSVGGLFAIFASLLLYNFISTSIRFKQKDIGILRSIGASSKDVFKIFFFESLIIALLCYILSLSFTIPITVIFDNILQKEYFVPVSFVFVGIRQIGLLLIISVIVALFASFIPIYNFSKKKPIDIIKSA